MATWQVWLDHPEKSWLRHILFQIHFLIGAVAAAYVFVMSLSGSLIVYRDELFALGFSIEGLVELHANLLAGQAGRFVNGIGAISLTLLCLTGSIIWWPGINHWRRSLGVAWRASFARVNWDVHSALGFWAFGFVLMWGVSGVYLVFPDQFTTWLFLNPAGDVSVWLAQLHFGRFSGVTQALWGLVGLAPGVLAFTGMFVCCRRVIFKKPSNPKSQSA
jgi:uncharacterized iron-regulated membrane protein